MYICNTFYFVDNQIQYLQIQKVIVKWLYVRIKWGNPNLTRGILFEAKAFTS
jgi:hypothetical protein